MTPDTHEQILDDSILCIQCVVHNTYIIYIIIMLTHYNDIFIHSTYIIYIIIMYIHNNYVKLHKIPDGSVNYVNM
jgi:hypothetical protein